MSKLKSQILTISLLVLTILGTAKAGPFENAMEALEREDYASALELLVPLAEQGDADAQNNLGRLYVNGQGVPQDYAEYVKWCRLAAEQGLATAQSNLGVSYDKGLGVPQDYAEAIKWYRLAAEQGHADAQSNLGVMYATGEGVAIDFVKAHFWFILASDLENQQRTASQMTPDQVAEAQRLAREWKPK